MTDDLTVDREQYPGLWLWLATDDQSDGVAETFERYSQRCGYEADDPERVCRDARRELVTLLRRPRSGAVTDQEKLLDACRRLIWLNAHPEPGIAAWHVACCNAVDEIRAALAPAAEGEG